jgi:4-amino-4-deoxy-L-arabinose transferase-like glycosyltransferase
MRVGDSWRKLASSDLGVLVLWATAGVLLHTVTNGQYGFHHDELATLDDTRSMAWGYAAYPPLTPFLTRIAFILFGPSLIGLRFFAAVALGLVLVLTGLVARHLGGGKAGTNRGSAGRGDRRGGGCMATTCKGLVSGR